MAGLTRRVLVYPPAMIWPGQSSPPFVPPSLRLHRHPLTPRRTRSHAFAANLGQVALNKSFHQEQNLPANGWTISRLKYFLILFTAYGLYYVRAISRSAWFVMWPGR